MRGGVNLGVYSSNTVLMHVFEPDREEFKKFARSKGYTVPELMSIIIDKLSELDIQNSIGGVESAEGSD